MIQALNNETLRLATALLSSLLKASLPAGSVSRSENRKRFQSDD